VYSLATSLTLTLTLIISQSQARNEFGGAFSKIVRVEERFAVIIPEIIPSTLACPLMCAGATVFEPVCNYVRLGTDVGIYSIGGIHVTIYRSCGSSALLHSSSLFFTFLYSSPLFSTPIFSLLSSALSLLFSPLLRSSIDNYI
jgi:hypothetical protein